MQVASFDRCMRCGNAGSSRASSSSLLTDSTGYGSFPRRTPDSDSLTGPYYSTTVSDYGPTTESKPQSQSSWRDSVRLKSAISEASIDSLFRDGSAEYYDFDAVVLENLPCVDDLEEVGVRAGEDSLDDVAPSSELARAEIAEIASNIIDLIAGLKTSCSSSSASYQSPPIGASRAEEEHIYEEIANDSSSIQLHDVSLRPPPLPERRPVIHSASTLPAEFPSILRKKKLPSKHQDAPCVRWQDETTCGTVRRLTTGRKVAFVGDGGGGRTETKDFLTMPAASQSRATFA